VSGIKLITGDETKSFRGIDVHCNCMKRSSSLI